MPDPRPPRLLPRLWLLLALAVVVGGAARLGLWLAYAGHARPLAMLWPALGQGLRYDLATSASAAWLILLLGLPLLLLRRRALAVRLAEWMLVFVLAVFLLTAACEHFYYAFYKTRFDPIVFGLFEDDTLAILRTIWDEYPVVQGVIGLLALVLLLAWGVPRMAAWLDRRIPRTTRLGRPFAIAAQALLLLVVARGSFGTFPLVRQDLTVSPDPFCNELVLNAPLALYKAIRTNAKEARIGSDAEEGLRKLGFAGVADAAAAAGLATTDPARVPASLFRTAPGQPRPLAQSPHVVLALLESFGADLLYSDGPGNDLLGRLRPQLAHGYHFRNFITGQNGTHAELETLLLGSPITPLTRSRNARIAFDTSAALPFKRAGYRTAFVYAGGASWRRIGEAFSRQGFERVYDARDIRERFPKAHGTEWGIYDEYVFDFAADLLQRADARGERLFLFVLTTTNHPPFTLDTPHRDLPLDPSALGPRADEDKAELRSMMATYQYQADQFGAFLQRLDSGPLRQRVLLAAAGDHNLRTHYRYDLPAEVPDVDRIFGYLSVPDALRPSTPVDVQAFCGHADLVPTLVSLALPGQRYFDTGRNLLEPVADGGQALALYQRLYTREAVLFPLHKPEAHAWHDPRHIDVEGRAPSPGLMARARRVAAQVALRDWHLRSAVIAARKASVDRRR
ncbi:LTA synthase family protein [Luteimonas aquatica]|uniref:LTA synthase family protein n=1 Tax=Luteimonas aquatica TaxID=450364 RepID=UPI001F5A2567|nr:LTA synthase family protein [Luteimonas aquatica]